MYNTLREILFWFPPEDVHYFSMNCLSAAYRLPLTRRLIDSPVTGHTNLHRKLWGLNFRNPVGLAAGFDKNALYLNELSMLGFGSVEIGTVTPEPQQGNDKPRLFRIPEHQAIINRMGFNNDGVKTIAKRIRLWRNSHPKAAGRLVIGGNIGKNKSTSNEDAWRDYATCFTNLFDCVDYFVVNVSSPNTPGLRALQEKDALNKILSHLQTLNKQQSAPKPILLKIAPDLTTGQIDDVIDLAMEIQLDGLVVTNTTISREALTKVPEEELSAIGAGGLSGAPLMERSTALVRYIHERTNGNIPIIASGGIFTAKDAQAKFDAGASLIQVWTGFVYEGPGIVRQICKGLLKKADLQ